MAWTFEESRFDSQQGQEISLFFTLSRLELGCPSLLSSGQRELFLRGYSSRDMKLPTLLHLSAGVKN
jgi:hypothetical protein